MNEVTERNDAPSYGGELLSSGAAVQQMRTSYATAVTVQKPRQLEVVKRRVLDEAALGGADFYFGWGDGKDRIEGPSVKLANALARCWGNCALELLPVQETADAWIFTAVFIDLETGFTLPRQFRQAKGWKVYGKFDEERKADIRFQIGQSKAIRNVVLNALPAGLVEMAMDKAKEGVRNKIERYVKDKGLSAAVDEIVKALGKAGVKEPAILARVGKADRIGIDVEDIVILRGDLAAIQGGQERPEVLFPAPPEAAAAELLEKLKKRAEGKPEATAAPKVEPAAKAAAPKPIMHDQTVEIVREFTRLSLDVDETDAVLAPYGKSNVGELNTKEADDLLTRLRLRQR